MQSTKNKSLRSFNENIEMKEREHVTIWPKIVLGIKAVKSKLFPKEDLAQLHLERTNLQKFNNDHKARRAEMETATRMFLFQR